MKAGLLVNPHSGKGRNKGVDLARRLEGVAGVEIAVLDDFAELGGHLDRFAAAGVRDLFISSGDGTVQEIQTQLAERRPFAVPPRLALLAHGTTNLTASDLGFLSRSLDRQAQVIADGDHRAATRATATRHTMRIANPRDGKVRHGMFMGCGAIWQATKYCQTSVHGAGLRGEWATFATLASAVAKALFAKPSPDDVSRIDRPHEMCVRAGNRTLVEGGQLLFLASTLERLILKTRPFWGGKTAPIRASVFPYPPISIPRWLLVAMYGGEQRRLPQGCVSFCANAIDIETASPFVVDGEFFDPPETGPLRIETGVELTYIRA